MHWNAPAPMSWKRSTLRGLVKRVFTICSNDQLLKDNLMNLRKIFSEINGFPHWVVSNIIREVKDKGQTTTVSYPEVSDKRENPPGEQKIVRLTLSYKGYQGTALIKKLKRTVNKFLSTDVNTKIAFQARKLSSRFSTKDQTKKRSPTQYSIPSELSSRTMH